MKQAERFIQLLQKLEREHSADPLLELFTDESQLNRLNSRDTYKGRDGAAAFWNEYLSMFKEIASQFTHVIEAGDTAVLEWEAHGRFEGGEQIHYRGVSIVEFAGDQVRAFRTYYDTAQFSQPAHA
jgi:ketosteroid isomerase-like protein